MKPLLHLVDSCRLKEYDLGAREYEIKSGVIPNNNMGHTYGNNIWRNIWYKIKEQMCKTRARHMGTCGNNIRNNLTKHMRTNGFIVEMTLPLLYSKFKPTRVKKHEMLGWHFPNHEFTPRNTTLHSSKVWGPNEDYIVS